MQKKLEELVEEIATEHAERMLEITVDASVFTQVYRGEEMVKKEWEKADEDVKIIEKAAKDGAHRLLFKLQELLKSPGWPEDFRITNESIKADNIGKTLKKVSLFYHPDKLPYNM